ncbi:MAG: maltose alpha-D-glucosyltransferase, partial [Rhodospirillaceae bacterium]
GGLDQRRQSVPLPADGWRILSCPDSFVASAGSPGRLPPLSPALIRCNLSPRLAIPSWLLTVLAVADDETGNVGPRQDGNGQFYFLPLAIRWADGDVLPPPALLPFVLARVQQDTRIGFLHDATADDGFVRALTQAILIGTALPGRLGSRIDLLPATADGGRPTTRAILPYASGQI